MSTPIRHAVDILVDDAPAHLGALSYLVPAAMDLYPGDAVHVPFGKAERHGVVLGHPSNASAATREVISVWGQRIDPLDLDVAREVAETHFCPFAQIASRLSPRSDRNAAPLASGPVALLPRSDLPLPAHSALRRLYLRSPMQDPARIAALEAERLTRDRKGQVLILAPTVELLERTLAEFTSGALRLDTKAKAGAWPGFRAGAVTVGIGTRTAALYSARDLAGIVVIDEEHPGHEESQLPYTHAARIAAQRATAHNCALSLISANPSPSALSGKVKVISLTSAADWPNVTIIDKTALAPDARQLPDVVPRMIEKAKKANREVIAICQSAPAKRICVVCKSARACEGCKDPLCVTHPLDTPCARCGDMRTKLVGWDKQRLSALLKIPAYTFAELDLLPTMDRTVILLDVDGIIDAAKFDPTSFFSALTLRAIAAAGSRGEFIVGTSNPHHELISLLSERDQLGFAKLAWEQAKLAALPPFGRLVTIRVKRPSAPKVLDWPGKVAGPARKGDEWEYLIRIETKDLPLLAKPVERLRKSGQLRVWVK